MRAKHWMPDRLIRSTATFGRKRHWTHATEPAVPPLTLGISNPETAEPLIIWPTSPLAAPRPSGCGIPAACAWTATTTRRPGERSSRSGCATNVPRRCQSRSGCGCFRPSSTSTPAALTCSCRSATCWSKTSPSATRRYAGLASFVAGYGSWFQGQAAVAAELPEHLHPTADERLAHVAAEKEALRCFQFMNQVMRDHRKSLSEVQ